MLSNVVIGRMPFTLGIALAVGAWLCAERRAPMWLAVAAVLALACVLASPVAGAFLVLAAAGRAAGSGREALVPAAVAGAAGDRRRRRDGRRCSRRAATTASWRPRSGRCSPSWPRGPRCSRPGRRALRAGALLYIAVLIAAFVIPTPFGQNALRLPVLLGPALIVLAPRAGVPRAAVATVLVALLYLQWLPAVRAVAEAHGDPSTSEAFFADPRAFLREVVQPGERVEVAFTHNHWEAAHLASLVPLARGWERQLDEKANPLFYDGRPLTADRYHRWLLESGVRWVALPDAPLDYSAQAEARLLERGVPYLKLVHRSPDWRIWEVRDATPPASGGARVTVALPNGFDVDTRRPDGRPPALHALVALAQRLREPGARRLDPDHARRLRPRAGPRGPATGHRPGLRGGRQRPNSAGNPPGLREGCA